MIHEPWVFGVVHAELSLPQHGWTSWGDLDRRFCEWSPSPVHGNGNLAHVERIGENPTHLGNTGNRHDEANGLVLVNRANVLTLGHNLLPEDSPKCLEEFSHLVVGVTFGELLFGDVAQLDDESRDGLQGVAADRLGDELVPWVVRLWGEFEAHLVSFG